MSMTTAPATTNPQENNEPFGPDDAVVIRDLNFSYGDRQVCTRLLAKDAKIQRSSQSVRLTTMIISTPLLSSNP